MNSPQDNDQKEIKLIKLAKIKVRTNAIYTTINKRNRTGVTGNNNDKCYFTIRYIIQK